MGITKWWSKSQPRLNKKDSKGSQSLAEGSNLGKLVRNPSEASSVTRAKQAERILDSLPNLEVILKDANISREDFSPQKLLTQLQSGILLNQNKQKYWVDKMGKHCFMIYPRDFHITWGHDDRHWRWFFPEEISGNDAVEMAELVKVSWLDVSGGFDTIRLSPETLYEVSFVVMMKEIELVLWDTPMGSLHMQPDGRNRHGLSFVVVTENKVVWDSPVEQVPNVLVVMKNQHGTETPVTFIPVQPDGTRKNVSFLVMMENEDGTKTPETVNIKISTHKLSFMVMSKNDNGTVSPMSFLPTQPDGSGHQLSFAVTKRNEDGLYTPVTFIPSQPDGSRHDLSFAIMMNNEVVWETPVIVVPTLLDEIMHELSFVVTMKNEFGLETLVTFVPTQPDGSRSSRSFAITMKNDIGWDTPVTVELTQPDGSRHRHKVKMSNLPKEQWVEIPVGKFRTSSEIIGQMRFYMTEHEDQLWKRGLIVKGLKIQAKIT